MPMQEIVDISNWLAVEVEPGGAEAKVWVEPRWSQSGERWLFKPSKRGVLKGRRGASETHFTRGNDWAEAASYRIGIALGIPMAQTDIAQRDGVFGTISRDVSPKGWSLHSGSVRLAEIAPEYVPRTPQDKRPDRVGHNLDRIEESLANVDGPYLSPYANWDAFEVFASYLLLDALIGNQDRHEENWAVLLGPRGQLHLSPAFDHGSALSAGMPDSERHRILVDRRQQQWCANGRAMKAERIDGKPPTLLDLACDALSRCRTSTREHWVDRLTRLTLTEMDDVISTTPRMSEVARRLTSEILKINKERLLRCLAGS